MSDDPSVICRRCGFANVPGDQFCGSCGAFLEWEGQPADGPTATPPAGPEPAAPAPGPGAASPRDGLPTSTVGGTPPRSPATSGAWGAPAPAVQPLPAGSSGDPVSALIRCPACGIANPVARTFCQSCGATLVKAAPVAPPSAAEIAAAVARPATVPRATTSPVTGAAPRAVANAPSRGFPMWVVVIGLLGILVGAGVVAGSVLLGGQGPGSLATSAPQSAPAGSPGTSPGAPGGPSAAPPAGAAGVPLTLTSAKASSVVGNRAKFAAAMAIDGDPKTCWQEGNATEKGQWIEVSFAPSRVDAVVLDNGYQASTALYKGNLRLKDVLISVNGGTPIKATLQDTTKPQRIEVGGVTSATTVRITIQTTYPSVKTSVSGTPFDDAALGEIELIGVPAG